MALFDKKNKKKSSVTKEEPKNSTELTTEAGSSDEQTGQGSIAFSGTGGSDAHKVMRGFYVSEKSSLGNSMQQYTFTVFKSANKSEVKKEVARLFNVKVKTVKILNMPEKRRDFGKHPGAKTGFKKAIVVLREGYTIGQAKP